MIFHRALVGSKIAYGAGTWDLEIPNVLRISIGEWEAEAGGELLVAECNIDDMNGELYLMCRNAYCRRVLWIAG